MARDQQIFDRTVAEALRRAKLLFAPRAGNMSSSGNASATEAGLVPPVPTDSTYFLNGAAPPVFAHVKDSDLSTSDVTDNDVSVAKHGFAPKAPNDASKYLDGSGHYSVPPGTGGGLTFVLPVTAGFSWVNQGTATLTDTAGEYSLLAAPASGGRQTRMRVKAAPATPYTVTVFFLLEASASAAFPDGGIVLRESSSGKLVRLTVTTQNGAAPVVFIAKDNSPTSFNAGYTLTWPGAYGIVGNGAVVIPIWLRIQDDGTNRKCSVAADGVHWHLVHSVARTDFITPDQIGFGSNPDNAGSGMRIFHWAET